jgi:hypothetical protein
MKHKNFLIEDVEQLRDFNVNISSDRNLAILFENWILEIKNNSIKDFSLINYLKKQTEYWRDIDLNYSKFLKALTPVVIKQNENYQQNKKLDDAFKHAAQVCHDSGGSGKAAMKAYINYLTKS